ncbi:MAG TPA: dihydroorotate dehydrogenase-like protein [Myxococcaceae bacterium]|nr:dihydroorotate dehydrogenase-like protein [Myxococcaceae bacterium]
MDLSVDYLGLKLAHPFMPGASPLGDELRTVRALEDAGAAAIVMRSLFEEQLAQEQMLAHQATDYSREMFPEARSFFPEPEEYRLGPDAYLEQLRRVKAAVDIPVIGSLNGTTRAGWIEHARLIEEAGADALELNVFAVASDAELEGALLEQRSLELVRAVKETVRIPVAVKLSPFYTSLPHFARALEQSGADGLVLFNRLFQPEIDVEALDVKRELHLSDSSELPLRLRWLAILSPQLRLPLAVSGGIHGVLDALRALMAGATVVQLVSALLRHGPEQLARLRGEVVRWMEDHEYASIEQLRGSMSLAACPDPSAYQRANYIYLLQSWRG